MEHQEPLTSTRRAGAPWRVTDVVGVVAAGVATLGVLSYLVRGAPLEEVFGAYVVNNAPLGIAGSVGMAAALRRQPHNRAARYLFASSVICAVHVASYGLLHVLADADPGVTFSMARGTVVETAALPPLQWALLFTGGTIWVPAIALGLVLGVPLLPDGRWPGPRWRLLEPAAGVAAVLMTAAWGLYLLPVPGRVLVIGDVPTGTPLIEGLFTVGSAALGACGVAATIALVLQLRRADADQRARLRPVGVMALLVLVSMVVLYPWQAVWALVSAVTMTGLVVAVTVAMSRHQLFDVDVLVSRAVTAAVLAAFVTVTYVGIVAGVGWAVGDRGELWLALAATAAVAVAFEPLRRRVARWARRLVLGRRATAGDVLGQLSDELATSASTSDVLGHVAELLVAGTGADRAEVHTEDGAVATAGAHGGAAEVTRTAVIAHDGEQLGEVVLVARRADLLLPADEELLSRVAALLGPVLRTAALTADLQRTVDELRASRQRLVLAEESVRRSVERDIHDGAQQQLLAVRLQLGLTSALLDQGEVGRARDVVARAAQDTEAAIRGLRDLARGLYPPVLEQEGLAAALRSHLRTVPADATVEGDEELPELEPPVRAAVYLCCLEAIQNVTKHAGASTVRVRLGHDDGRVRFAVSDDGCGFDDAASGVGLHSIRDRVDALGGALDVDSTPGRGTTVRGWVPIAPGTDGSSPATAQSGALGDPPVSAR